MHPLFVHGKGAPEIVPVEKDVPPVETAPPGIPTGRASLSTRFVCLFVLILIYSYSFVFSLIYYSFKFFFYYYYS